MQRKPDQPEGCFCARFPEHEETCKTKKQPRAYVPKPPEPKAAASKPVETKPVGKPAAKAKPMTNFDREMAAAPPMDTTVVQLPIKPVAIEAQMSQGDSQAVPIPLWLGPASRHSALMEENDALFKAAEHAEKIFAEREERDRQIKEACSDAVAVTKEEFKVSLDAAARDLKEAEAEKIRTAAAFKKSTAILHGTWKEDQVQMTFSAFNAAFDALEKCANCDKPGAAYNAPDNKGRWCAGCMSAPQPIPVAFAAVAGV